MSEAQDTASKTGLLLQCPRPFEGEKGPDTPGEPALYGSAFHGCVDALLGSKPLDGIAAKYAVEDEKALHAHAAEAFKHLTKWIRGGNPWGRQLMVVSHERPLASRFKGDEVVTRECDFDEEDHRYDLRRGEWGGTADLVLETRRDITHSEGAHHFEPLRIVLDHKSGDWGTFHNPAKIPQLMTLALMTGANVAAVLHAPRGGIVAIYADELSPAELQAHAKMRRSARRLIGTGFLRTGAECARCPVRDACPAQDASLVKRAGALVKAANTNLSADVDKGTMHMFLQEFGRLSERARELLRDAVAAGEIIVRPDGKVLQFVKREEERLSKSSVVKALGKKEGEAMLNKLRRLGCLVKETRDVMLAVTER